jgi:hypothetical protein
MRWVSKANVKPDELRNCFIQHSSNSVTISHKGSVKLTTEKNFLIQKFKFNGIISEAMVIFYFKNLGYGTQTKKIFKKFK